MNQKTKKELVILVIVLIALSISLFSQLSKGPDVNLRTKQAKSNVPVDPAAAEGVRMDLLTSDSPEFTSVKRNIFQFGADEDSTPATVPSVDTEPSEPIAPPEPQLPDVRYLGFYYEKDTGIKMAALSNTGKVFVGKVGQVLAGRYEVVEIAADHVILRWLAEHGKLVRVPLGRARGSFVEDQKEKD